MNIFAYPEEGKRLRPVLASVNDAPNIPLEYVIANGSYSEIVNCNGDAKELIFRFTFGAAATGDVLIEECIDATASVAGTTFDTLTVTAQRTAEWNSGEALNGHFRIKNTSGQSLTVTAQKRIG